jgi:hypothetical protein
MISALNFPGNPARILQMAENGIIRLAVSDDILNEFERVLQRPKFGWTQDQVDNAIREPAADVAEKYKAIQEYNNTQWTESLVPLYREMLDHFTHHKHLAEQSTRMLYVSSLKFGIGLWTNGSLAKLPNSWPMMRGLCKPSIRTFNFTSIGS